MASRIALLLALSPIVQANFIPPHGGDGWAPFSWPWGSLTSLVAQSGCAPITVTLPAGTVTLPASTVTLTVTTTGADGSNTLSSSSSSSIASTTLITTSSSTSSLNPAGTAAIVNVAAASRGGAVLDGFVSFSIEFAFFPDFAGLCSGAC